MLTPPLGLLGRARLIGFSSIGFLQGTCQTQSFTRLRPFLGSKTLSFGDSFFLVHLADAWWIICAELVQAMEVPHLNWQMFFWFTARAVEWQDQRTRTKETGFLYPTLSNEDDDFLYQSSRKRIGCRRTLWCKLSLWGTMIPQKHW
jgi:hypothetical protein